MSGDPFLAPFGLPRETEIAMQRIGAKERAWQQWTPRLYVGSGAGPQDVGTRTGQYRMLDSRTMAFQMRYVAGATNPSGAQLYRWSLPGSGSTFASSPFAASVPFDQVVSAVVIRGSGNLSSGVKFPCDAHVKNVPGSFVSGPDTGLMWIEVIAGPGTNAILGIASYTASSGISNSVPFTWQSDDMLMIGGVIECDMTP